MTVTEALAELKTIDKRIATKRQFILQYLVRSEGVKDPLMKDGGSEAAIAGAMQAIGDLEQRKLTIRREIQKINSQTDIAINGAKRSVADWLVWRRDVAPGRQQSLAQIRNLISNTRQEVFRKGYAMTTPGEAKRDTDVLVHVNETKLAEDIEAMETTLGVLDGQLSLKNATMVIDV